MLGAPHHLQGQGAVETQIREIASAIIATLGAKAERGWFSGPWLSTLEGVINSTVVMHMECSPYGVLHTRVCVYGVLHTRVCVCVCFE